MGFSITGNDLGIKCNNTLHYGKPNVETPVATQDLVGFSRPKILIIF